MNIIKLPFDTKEQVISQSKKLQKEIYNKIYKQYFNTLKESELANIKRVKDNKSRMYAFYIGTKKKGTFYVNAIIMRI